MALIVEDGTIVAGAESYTSVTFADAYFLTHLYSAETWTALTTTQKENGLRAATIYLDQTFVWEGVKTDEDSALRWPRTGVYTIDDVLIGANTIPTDLQKAVCEQAITLLASDVFTASESTGIQELKVDVIELKFDKTDKSSTLNSRAALFLNGFGVTSLGSKIVKVYRS